MKQQGIILNVLICVCYQAFASPPLQIRDSPRFHESKPVVRRFKTENVLNPPLPPSLYPDHYRIKIRPILYPEGSPEEWTAPGSVEITGRALLETNQIVLHAHRSLTVPSTSIQILDEDKNLVPWISLENSSMSLSIRLERNLTLGRIYTITAKFVADIGTGLDGLYRAYYKDDAGKKKRMAITQLEETSARKVFPCFDEPRFKSTFSISVARRQADEGYISLSNTDQTETNALDKELPPGWVYDHYRETQKMPVYLVAIAVTESAYKEAPEGLWSKNVKIYGKPDVIRRGGADFAAVTTAKVMAKLEEIFEHDFEMPKLDSLAIPDVFFESYGMENYGLIMYRETGVMYHKGKAAEVIRQNIASLIAHEAAHQWFGNLVTCKWWSHIWLNEGFASYFEIIGLDEVYPEFQARRTFLPYNSQASLSSDVGYNYPMVSPEEDRDSTGPLFIHYSKGSSLLRMMEGFLGYETLRKALAQFLKKFAYQSVDQDDLFQSVGEQVRDKLPPGKTLKNIMDTWTLQPGYPLIRLSVAGPDAVNITQERLQPFKTDFKTDSDNLTWEVPIAVATERREKFSSKPILWLPKEDKPFTLGHDTSLWLLLNPDGYGYYRVLYDDHLLELISQQLKKDRSKISGLSRSQLLDDYFHLARLGHVPITTALDLTLGMETEYDCVVWFTFLNAIQRTLPFMVQEYPKLFKKYLAPKIDAAMEKVTWNQGNDSGIQVIYRARLADWACSVDSPGCVQEAKRIYKNYKLFPAELNKIPVDLQPVIYCSVVAFGGEGAFDFILQQYGDTQEMSFKDQLLRALSCANDSSSLQKLMNLSLDANSELSNHTEKVFGYVTENVLGKTLVAQMILTKFEELKAHVGETDLMDMVEHLIRHATTDLDRENLEQIVKEKDLSEWFDWETLQFFLDAKRTRIQKMLGNLTPWLEKQS